ncbi:MAG: 30S ribosomal protein S14 [Chlorobiota bacterium]|jgi:small subunit ribosomal protein S14|nr:30S ribosomal protein S14 [Chlorobiota bacterium]QQS65760.1 MAG: 30S ribosomal protein S14 [Chlorobiota bacterium]
MAREALKAREVKRKKLVEKYAELRAQYKAVGDNESLQKLPKNSSKNRIRNRCSLTGRPRGYYRKFGLCRNQLRELALEGKIPGLRKASW